MAGHESVGSDFRWSRRPTTRKHSCVPDSSGPACSLRPASETGARAARGYTLPVLTSDRVRIIPLGGLGEVGKNMTVVESEEGIVVIDAGLAFPRDEHLGVDLLLPDFAYLRDREDEIRARHPHARPRGSRRRAARIFLREIDDPGGLGDAADARLDQVEARRARAAARGRAHRGRAGGWPGRHRAVHGRVRAHGALDPGRRRGRPRHARRPDRPHGRLQDRPHAGRRIPHRRRTARRDRESRASTCCWETPRTPSGPASPRPSEPWARPSGRSSRAWTAACSSRRSPRTSTGCSRQSTWRSRPIGTCA